MYDLDKASFKSAKRKVLGFSPRKEAPDPPALSKRAGTVRSLSDDDDDESDVFAFFVGLSSSLSGFSGSDVVAVIDEAAFASGGTTTRQFDVSTCWRAKLVCFELQTSAA